MDETGDWNILDDTMKESEGRTETKSSSSSHKAAGLVSRLCPKLPTIVNSVDLRESSIENDVEKNQHAVG